jgi:MFS family permease
MQFTNRIGFNTALTVSMVFAIIYHVGLYVSNEDNIWWLFPILVAGFGLYRIFHWVPYQVDFLNFTQKGERGRIVSFIFATLAIMGIVGPALGGYITQSFGYDSLFVIGILLFILAGVSYYFVPEVDLKFEWNLRETFLFVIDHKFRKIFWGDFAYGVESVVGLIAWPVFLFELLNGELLDIGLLSMLIVALTVLVQLSIGRYIDAGKRTSNNVLMQGSVIYAIGWILKMFIATALHVFLVGVFHNIARIFTITPYTSILLDVSGDQGEYTDEFTVAREIALNTGRVIGTGCIVLLALAVSVKWTFILAAVATLVIGYLFRESSRILYVRD